MGFARGYLLRKWGVVSAGRAPALIAREAIVCLGQALIDRNVQGVRGRRAGWRAATPGTYPTGVVEAAGIREPARRPRAQRRPAPGSEVERGRRPGRRHRLVALRGPAAPLPGVAARPPRRGGDSSPGGRQRLERRNRRDGRGRVPRGRVDREHREPGLQRRQQRRPAPVRGGLRPGAQPGHQADRGSARRAARVAGREARGWDLRAAARAARRELRPRLAPIVPDAV